MTGNKIKRVVLKHLPGQHNQKRHGWRYGNISAVRRGMRAGVSEDFDKTTPEQERGEYRKRAGLPEPSKIPKVDPSTYAKTKEEKYLANLIGNRTPSYKDLGTTQNCHNEFHNLSSWQKWKSSLTRGEEWAIKEYTSYNYAGTGTPFNQRPFKKLNSALRDETFDASRYPNSAITKIKSKLDGLMEKSSLHRDLMLYRGFGSDNFFRMASDGTFKRGSVMSDKGFVSSSPAQSTAKQFQREGVTVWGKSPVYMRIKAPKGTKGIYVTHPDINKFTNQSEFVLPRNTKFIVENIGFETINGYRTAVYDLIAVTE